MNKTDLVRLRNKIVTMLAELDETVATARAAVKESSEVIPNFLQDESGAAKGGIDLENALQIHGHCTAQLEPLRHALMRMNLRDYGNCQDCGCEIGLRRLEAVPSATFCIHCQEESELRIIPMPRPSKIVGSLRSWWAA